MKPEAWPETWLDQLRPLVLAAGAEVMRLKDQPLESERKEDQSIVTIADLNSDQILREGLLKAFPEHGILTEESGILGNEDSEYVWLVDPLDGTKAYAKGIAGFSVMVGLLKAGQPCLGAVFDPLSGRLYEGAQDHGAFLIENEARRAITVSTRDQFSEMPLLVSTGCPQEPLAKLQQALACPLAEPINSVGIKVGVIVRQVADIYLSHHPVHHWDTCAPQAILEAAGGTFTKLDGSTLEYKLEPPYSHHTLTLATNGTRHQDVVQLIADTRSFQ